MTDLRTLERELAGNPDYSPANIRSAAAEANSMRRERVMAEWTGKLRELGCSVSFRNHGVLMVVQFVGRKFDVWPATGRWAERDNSLDRHRMAFNRAARQSGHGLDTLCRAVQGLK